MSTGSAGGSVKRRNERRNDFMKHWIIVIVAITLMILHERLSTAKLGVLGGVLPLTGIAAMVYRICWCTFNYGIHPLH